MAKNDLDVTDDELDLLSDEERAALKDDDDPDQQEASSEDDAEEDSAEEADDTETLAADAEETEEEETEDPTGEEAAPEKPAGKVDPAILATRYDPEQVDNLDEKFAALDKQLEEGEITESQYREQSRALTVQQAKIEMAAEANQQADQQNWDFCQKLFFEDHPEWQKSKNPALYGALCAEMEVLGQDESIEGKTYLWYLREARARVAAAFKLDQPQEAPKDEPKVEPSDKKAAVKKMAEGAQKKPEPPKTLANVPAAGANDETGSLDSLDGLEGLEAEAAFANLSAAEQEKYLTQH